MDTTATRHFVVWYAEKPALSVRMPVCADAVDEEHALPLAGMHRSELLNPRTGLRYKSYRKRSFTRESVSVLAPGETCPCCGRKG